MTHPADIGLTDEDRRKAESITDLMWSKAGAGRRGGLGRAESICPTCHNPLDVRESPADSPAAHENAGRSRDGAAACEFCRPPPSAADFEHGDEAADEFLYRCGVVD